MPLHEEFVGKNALYAADFGEKGALPLKPAKKLAIGQCVAASTSHAPLTDWLSLRTVTCMDARIKYVLDPAV